MADRSADDKLGQPFDLFEGIFLFGRHDQTYQPLLPSQGLSVAAVRQQHRAVKRSPFDFGTQQNVAGQEYQINVPSPLPMVTT